MITQHIASQSQIIILRKL